MPFGLVDETADVAKFVPPASGECRRAHMDRTVEACLVLSVLATLSDAMLLCSDLRCRITMLYSRLCYMIGCYIAIYERPVCSHICVAEDHDLNVRMRVGRYLQMGLGLEVDPDVPLIACITRLVPQKVSFPAVPQP